MFLAILSAMLYIPYSLKFKLNSEFPCMCVKLVIHYPTYDMVPITACIMCSPASAK